MPGKPVPNRILEMRGSKSAKYNHPNEAQPSGDPCDCPDFLSNDAAIEWEAIAPKLERMGVLADVDQNTLARYCELWVEWKQCRAVTQELGVSYSFTTTNGEHVHRLRPETNQALKLIPLLLRLEESFGMTPSGRCRVAIDESKKDTSKAASYFGQSA